MYDHLGGGFPRYSVDGHWLVPHFEKMLYDNAQLAMLLPGRLPGHRERPLHQVARETLDYLLRDLRDPRGGFHSAGTRTARARKAGSTSGTWRKWRRR